MRLETTILVLFIIIASARQVPDVGVFKLKELDGVDNKAINIIASKIKINLTTLDLSPKVKTTEYLMQDADDSIKGLKVSKFVVPVEIKRVVASTDDRLQTTTRKPFTNRPPEPPVNRGNDRDGDDGQETKSTEYQHNHDDVTHKVNITEDNNCSNNDQDKEDEVENATWQYKKIHSDVAHEVVHNTEGWNSHDDDRDNDHRVENVTRHYKHKHNNVTHELVNIIEDKNDDDREENASRQYQHNHDNDTNEVQNKENRKGNMAEDLDDRFGFGAGCPDGKIRIAIGCVCPVDERDCRE